MDQSTIVKIINYGALKYSAERICIMLGLNDDQTDEFLRAFQNTKSEIRKAYERGVAIGQYNIDAALAKASENGDIFSIQQLKENQEKRESDDLIKKLFGV